MCQHNKLVAINDFAGIEVHVEDAPTKVSGMFTFKQYKCDDCGRIVTVLNAVVEEIENAG